MRLGFRLLLPGGRGLCAERRLAGDARGAQKRQTKLKKKKKRKKKDKKKKAERRKAPAN